MTPRKPPTRGRDREDLQFVHDPADLRKWRTELPNLYDDADLTPFEFRLLAHYKRVGNCFEGVRATARICHMSNGQVVAARKSLSRKRAANHKPFIQIAKKKSEWKTLVVSVVDVWAENFEHFSKMKRSHSEPSGVQGVTSRVQGVNGRVQEVNGRVHTVNGSVQGVNERINYIRSNEGKKVARYRARQRSVAETLAELREKGLIE